MTSKTDLFFLACVIKNFVPLVKPDADDVEAGRLLFSPRIHRLLAENTIALNQLYESIDASVKALDEGKNPIEEVDRKFCS